MQFINNICWVIEDFLYLLQKHTKVFIPFLFWSVGVAFAITSSLHYIDKNANADDFLGIIIDSSLSFLLFNIIFCPIVIIGNLWVMNIIKQANNQNDISVGSAFIHAIGFKLLMLLPFVLIWMGIQFIFIFIVAIVVFLAGLSRGNIGGNIMGKLIGGIFSISVFITFFLYLITPGMVLDDKNMFSSARNMIQYIKEYLPKFLPKLYGVVNIYLLLTIGVFAIFNFLIDSENTFFQYYLSIYFPIVTLSFIYYLQIKAGQFYIWAKTQNSFEPIKRRQ